MTQRTRIVVLVGLVLALTAFILVTVRTSPPTVALNNGSYNVPMQQGAKLSLDVSAGGVEVLAGDVPEMHIEYLGDLDRQPQVRVRTGTRRIDVSVQGMQDNSRLIVTVPKQTDLQVTLAAGELTIRNLVGDKDLTVYAGRIAVGGDSSQYRQADAKVLAGRINAPPMHLDKGGVFRWATWNGPGKSWLSANVLSGEVFISN